MSSIAPCGGFIISKNNNLPQCAQVRWIFPSQQKFVCRCKMQQLEQYRICMTQRMTGKILRNLSLPVFKFILMHPMITPIETDLNNKDSFPQISSLYKDLGQPIRALH
jgi:hypothetical protein